MTNFYEDLLSVLLDCGTADISIIEDTKYDIGDMVERAKEFGNVTLSGLTYAIISKGISDFEDAVQNRIETIEEEYDDFDTLMDGMDEDEYYEHICNVADSDAPYVEVEDMADILNAYKELNALKGLDVQQDIEFDFNYLATRAYFVNNTEDYQKYCKDIIADFERNTGFSL